GPSGSSRCWPAWRSWRPTSRAPISTSTSPIATRSCTGPSGRPPATRRRRWAASSAWSTCPPARGWCERCPPPSPLPEPTRRGGPETGRSGGHTVRPMARGRHISVRAATSRGEGGKLMKTRRNVCLWVGAAWVAVLALGGTSALADSAEPIRVHCRGAGAGGFVTPEVGDSLKDLLRGRAGKKDVVRLVDSPDKADLVVTVQGRGYQETGRRVYRSTRTRHSYRSTSSKETVKVVRASLEAGAYKLTIYGVDNSFWKSAA